MRERTSKSFRAGAAVLLLLVVVGLAAPLVATDRAWIARDGESWSFPAFAWPRPAGEPSREATVVGAPIPHDPLRIDLETVLNGPSLRHPFGTDGIGRDVASRLVHGARVSLGVGLLAACVALVVGIPLGAVAGSRRGAADVVVSRIVEAVLCFPTLLLALACLAAAPVWLLKIPDSPRIALVIGATAWTPVARYLRGEFLRLRGSDAVAAARASGAGGLRIAVRHVLPRALSPVLVTAAFTVGAAILLEAALSFLGLGIRPPIPTWGGMLTEARAHVRSAWWLAVFPGAALFLTVLGCNLVAEGIRDRLDPRGGSR